jgi:hypothetical protein
MVGDLSPTEGTVNRHTHLSIGRYHQHSTEVLNESVTCLEFFRQQYPNTATFSREVCRYARSPARPTPLCSCLPCRRDIRVGNPSILKGRRPKPAPPEPISISRMSERSVCTRVASAIRL